MWSSAWISQIDSIFPGVCDLSRFDGSGLSSTHLQLGRAYALAGDAAKSRTAYQDFFALWKDADPDIPVLVAAKAEYAKLK